MTDNRGTDGVVESASATTSPDNTNSGPIAYVITAVALVVCALVIWGMTACTASVIDMAAATSPRQRGRGSYNRYYDDYEDYFDDYLDDLEDLDFYFNN